jgi:hypothetical protein
MDHDQTLLEVNGSQFFSIDKSHQLIKLQRGTVKLTTDGIAYQYGSEAGMIPLDRIRYISVEQAHKLSITDDNRTLQFTLNKSSALQWQHYLRRLMKGEKPVRSN